MIIIFFHRRKGFSVVSGMGVFHPPCRDPSHASSRCEQTYSIFFSVPSFHVPLRSSLAPNVSHTVSHILFFTLILFFFDIVFRLFWIPDSTCLRCTHPSNPNGVPSPLTDRHSRPRPQLQCGRARAGPLPLPLLLPRGPPPRPVPLPSPARRRCARQALPGVDWGRGGGSLPVAGKWDLKTLDRKPREKYHAWGSRNRGKFQELKNIFFWRKKLTVQATKEIDLAIPGMDWGKRTDQPAPG